MKNILIQISNDKRSVNNNIFNLQNDINWSVYKETKKLLLQNKITISTFDMNIPGKADVLLYMDIPYPWDMKNWNIINKNKEKNILFCCEPPIVNPFNYNKRLHTFFKKIYTWNDNLVDNKKYYRYNWPQSEFGIDTEPVSFKSKKFLCLINGNKLPFKPFAMLSQFGRELYSERIKAIEYYEKTLPDEFSLYGKGWNIRKKRNLKEALFGYKKYKTYKGTVDNKIELLSQYKYSICFENLTNVDGYFTEKIFDCFKARCVPIYWGASNVSSYIPEGCYIDYRNHGTYEKLLKYLQNIGENEYSRYIGNIQKFLQSNKYKKVWSEEAFANNILQIVKNTAPNVC